MGRGVEGQSAGADDAGIVAVLGDHDRGRATRLVQHQVIDVPGDAVGQERAGL